MQHTVIVNLSLALGALLGAASAAADVVDTREVEESFAVNAREPLVVVVKNVIGSVRVTGHDADRVEMKATETVRGDLQASFERAPGGPMSFKTVNGNVDVTFPESLSAELGFATMNGDVFTDFDVDALSPPPPEPTRKRGANFVRANRNTAFRVGSGGDRHSFNTLNGNIYVRKAKS